MEVTITATFTSTTDIPGNANGILTIHAVGSIPSSYRLCWGNSDGPLPAYTPFAPIPSTGEITIYTMVNNTLIPHEADRILVYAADDDKISDTPAIARLPEGIASYDLGEVLYELQVQSDIHITLDQNHPHNRHFAMVLEEISRLSPDSLGLFINGDTGDTADPAQYENCQAIIDASPDTAPNVYFAVGNHDFGFDGTDYETRLTNFLKGTRNTWSDKAYFDLWIGGVHFIFLGSELKGCPAWLGEEQLRWLEEKLAENRDEHRAVYVFLHQGMVDTVAGCFAYQKWHGVHQTAELSAILSRYPEAILFSGHSHWVLRSTNTMRIRGENRCTIFNTSAGGYTWNDECMVTDKGLTGCEGYYFYGYKDKVVARGRDFLAGKWIPEAQFIVRY